MRGSEAGGPGFGFPDRRGTLGKLPVRVKTILPLTSLIGPAATDKDLT